MTNSVHWDLRNPHYIRWSDFLQRSQNWSLDEIQRFQLRELRRVVRHAINSTHAYKARFEELGIDARSIETLEDMNQFPLLEKEMIRDSLESFSIQSPDREYVTTGGSTGVPLGLYRDRISFARELASKAHQYRRIGWREGDPQLVLRAVALTTPNHMKYEPDFNELRCSSFHLSDEVMETYRLAALEYQPKWIKCLPSSGLLFARYLLESGKRFPRVAGVLCSSENLHEHQRAMMQQAFGGRVFSHYGHYEMSALAGYCEFKDTYHVLPQYGYVELISGDQPVTTPGQIGEIVATSFIMRCTPFIRYRTRDLAVFESEGCADCGRPYQVWSRIVGRFQEFLVTKSGRYVSVNAMNVHDSFYDHVREFQFAQFKEGEIFFRFIPRSECNQETLESMRRTLFEKLAGEAEIVMTPVSSIPTTSRGKRNLLDQHLVLNDVATKSNDSD